jgi:undecaprenyl-diphosphatase
VPAGLAGLLLEKIVESRLRGPQVVALSLIFWGLVMYAVDRHAAKRGKSVTREQDVGWRQGMLVGVAQAIALIPGTSRSGITITAGLAGGLDRPTAARFAFLLSIPITGAAGGHKALSLLRHGGESVALAPVAVGIATSFVAGLVAVWFLVNFLQRRSLLPFVVYRCALGLVILGVLR